ncbi:MAG: phage tail family protein [Bacteroidales bacterium]|nr:phage tail family protein [Bacteroidales bacterium]
MNYQILDIGGLNPPRVQINRSNIASLDGSKYNSSRVEERNIVISVKLCGDVEENRLNLYRLFTLKRECKLYYKNERRDVFISGYVESIECDYFTNKETVQISIVCPYPYFKDIDLVIDDITKVLRRFRFPFSIEHDDPIPFSEIEINRIVNIFNHGEDECGIIIDVTFIGSVNQLKLLNAGTGETFVISHSFVSGDKLVINTNKGEKSAILTRDGVSSNMFSKVVRGSTFFVLRQGNNYFTYLADNGEHDSNVTITYKHYLIFGGV